MIYAWTAVEFGFPYVRICPFCLLTSLPCPLCGLTQAFGHLLHGNINQAAQFHMFVIPLLFFGVGFTVYYLIVFVRDIKALQRK